MISELEQALKSVNVKIGIAMQRLQVLRQRQTVLEIWIKEESEEAAVVEAPVPIPVAAQPKPSLPTPRVVHLSDDEDDDGKPIAPPKPQPIPRFGDLQNDTEPSDASSTRGAILQIIRESAKPLTAIQIFEMGKNFTDHVQVSAALSHMTLKKEWLDRIQVDNPIPVRSGKGRRPEQVFAYLLKKNVQIPEHV